VFKYKQALLDIKKARLNAQEERIKHERQAFSLKQKISSIESYVSKFKHESPPAKSLKKINSELELLKAEEARLENKKKKK